MKDGLNLEVRDVTNPSTALLELSMYAKLTGINHFHTRDALTMILQIENEKSFNFVGINLENGSSVVLSSFDTEEYEDAFIRSITEDFDQAGKVKSIEINGYSKKRGEKKKEMKIKMNI